jgi:hypothetical protein
MISVSVRGSRGINAVAAGSSFSRLWILRLEIRCVVRREMGCSGPMRPGVRGEVRVSVLPAVDGVGRKRDVVVSVRRADCF